MPELSHWNGEKDYVISNVTIVDPLNKKMKPGHVGVSDGKVAFIEAGEAAAGDRPVFDGRGLHLSPGFVDIHVHLREPGYEHKETIRSGGAAAVAGGFTSVCCMPNTDPPIDEKSVVEFILRKARAAGFAKVYPIGAATRGRKGEALGEYFDLVDAGAVAVSDDGAAVPSAQMVRRVMEYTLRYDIPFVEHCEDPSLTAGGVMHEGFYSTKLGLRGVPSYSEEACLARDLIVLKSVPARYHAAHLSSKGSVDLIRDAKRKGLAVTAETAPHYLCFTDEALQTFDTNLRINPPIRSREDQDALVEGLKDGTIDCIASDHAPHAPQEKQVEFEEAPPGAIGLETTFSVLMTRLVKPGHLSLLEALSLITHRPAAVMGIPGGSLEPGAPADLALFDPDEAWEVKPGDFYSRSSNSPFIRHTLRGRVKYAVVDGEVVTNRLKRGV